MIKRIKESGCRIEEKLKDLCGEITPDKRLSIILIVLLSFTALNIYFTFSAISSWGRQQEKKKQLKIEHIERMELQNRRKQENLIDSTIEPFYADTVFYKPENERT